MQRGARPSIADVVAAALIALAALGCAGAQAPGVDDHPPLPPVDGEAAELPDPHESAIDGARPDADAIDFHEITASLVDAVDGGLRYLAYLQSQEQEHYVGKSDYRIAVTALAGLAFMAGGSTVTTGPYAQNVRDSVEFFLRLRGSPRDEWEIAAWDDKSRLHGHGYATLFLAQAYGTCGRWEKREELETALREAVQLSIRGQERQGGWGYQARDSMHEGSITVTQLQALRAARDAGISVPMTTISAALDYLDKSKVERSDWAYFVYRLGTASQPSFPLAAAAISSLNAVGRYNDTTVEKGLAFMRRYIPGHDSRATRLDQRYSQFWYYGQLYAVQAMFQAGGADWERWFPAIRDELVDRKEPYSSRGGSGKMYVWGRGDAESIYGQAYCTAVACIILQVPYRLLPMLQR